MILRSKAALNLEQGLLMRIKLYPLLFLGLTASFTACGKDDDRDRDDGLGGGGMMGDGDGSTGGTAGESSGEERACTSRTAAEGQSGYIGGASAVDLTLIDDFEAQSPWMLERDGRDGTWVDAHFLTPFDEMNTEQTDPVFVEEDGNSFVRLACEAESDDDEDLPCNTRWDAEEPYQWAALSALFVNANGTPCYDASIYRGIQFRARASGSAQQIRLQMNTPSDDRFNHNSFNSPEILLTSEWETYQVRFSEVRLEEGGELVDPHELESVSFVVRNIRFETSNGESGESLRSYSIDLDQVEFY